MTTWPASLPQAPLAQGYSEQQGDNVVRYQVEQGPAQMRMRSTRQPRIVACTYFLTTAQKAALDEWVAGTIRYGATVFDWPNPVTGGTEQARMTAPPVYSPVAGGMRWHATLALELWS